MLKRIFIAFILLNFIFGKAQQDPVDSLITILKTSKNDTNRVNQLNALAWELKNIYTDTAIVLGKKALQLAEKISWDKGIALAHQQLGVFHYFQSDYAYAIDHYYKALAIYEVVEKDGKVVDRKAHLTFKSKTYGYLGLAYANHGEIRKALDNYFKALKIDESLNNKVGLAKHYGNIGIVYFDQKNYPKALEYYEKALKLSEELNMTQLQANTLGNIALWYAFHGDSVKALNQYTKVLEIAQKNGFKQLEANTLSNIGEIYIKIKGKEKVAMEYFNKALKLKQELGDRRLITITLGEIGSLYAQQKKYPESEQYLKRALKLADSLGILNLRRDYVGELGTLYAKTNRFKESYYYHVKYVELRDSFKLEENQRETTKKELQFEYDKKAAADSIRNLEEKKTIAAQIAAQKEQLKREETQRYALYGGLALLFIFGAFMYNRVKITQRQKLIIEEQKSEVEIQRDLARKEHELVEEKQKEILDSIKYAKRIQQALMANEKYIEKNLNKLQNKKPSS